MLICDECKGADNPMQHNIFMTGRGDRDIIGSLDLCKGCQPIFRKRIDDLIRAVRRKKK